MEIKAEVVLANGTQKFSSVKGVVSHSFLEAILDKTSIYFNNSSCNWKER